MQRRQQFPEYRSSPRGTSNTDILQEIVADSQDLDVSSEQWAEKAREVVEKLSTKDLELRVRYLNFLLAVMRRYYAAEELQSDADTIRERLDSVLQKGSDEEKELAAELYEVLILTFPELEMKQKTLTALKYTTTDEEDHVQNRNTAINLLYFYKFVQMDEDLHDELNDLKELFTDEDVNITAINMYALLITLLDDESRADLLEEVGEYLEPLLELDHSADFNIAAGKLLCQLVESYHRRERTDCGHIVHKLNKIVEQHSTYTSKTHSRKNAKEQRKMFREFLDTFENQNEPEHSLIVNGHEVSIEGWNKVVRFEALTDVLQGGIVEHITENDVVRSMLDVHADISKRKSGLTKSEKVSRSKEDRYMKNKTAPAGGYVE